MSIEALSSPQSPVLNPASPPTVGLGEVTDTPTASDSPIKGNVQAFDSEDGPGFSDILDIINPLQHIPIVNTIYRELTGDDEGAVADLVGGGLIGGPIGLMAAVMDLMVKEATGKRIGDNLVALFDDSDNASVPVADAAATDSDSKQEESAAQPAAQAVPDKSAASEPALAGEYLVFGARTPVSTTPLPAAPGKTVKTKTPVSDARPSSPTDSAMPKTADGYMIFGSTAPSPSQGSAQTAMAGTTNRGSTDARFWPVPNRSAAVNARQTLPPPTTGPGALPGGQSVAVSAGQAATDGSGEWFARAFHQAMDKYQRASRLTEKTGESADGGSQTLH